MKIFVLAPSLLQEKKILYENLYRIGALVYSTGDLLAVGIDHDLSFPTGMAIVTSIPNCRIYTRCRIQLNKRDIAISFSPY